MAPMRISDDTGLPMSLEQYLELLVVAATCFLRRTNRLSPVLYFLRSGYSAFDVLELRAHHIDFDGFSRHPR